MEWTSVLLSALFAGIVATAVTVAIEKWGGLVGGLLGTCLLYTSPSPRDS